MYKYLYITLHNYLSVVLWCAKQAVDMRSALSYLWNDAKNGRICVLFSASSALLPAFGILQLCNRPKSDLPMISRTLFRAISLWFAETFCSFSRLICPSLLVIFGHLAAIFRNVFSISRFRRPFLEPFPSFTTISILQHHFRISICFWACSSDNLVLGSFSSCEPFLVTAFSLLSR